MFPIPDGWEGHPAVTLYFRRPLVSVQALARRFFVASLVFMFIGALLFAEATLDYLPGVGLAVRFAILVPSMIIFLVGGLFGAVWNLIDRALHGEPPPRPEGALVKEMPHILHAVYLAFGGALIAVATEVARGWGVSPVLILLVIVALLVAILGSLVLLEAHRRRRPPRLGNR